MDNQEKRNAPGTARFDGEALGTGLHAYATARRYPRQDTARANVLDALQRGQRLTSADALALFGTSRLAADVHALKRMNWPVQAETVPVVTRHGKSHVARYFLPPEVTP